MRHGLAETVISVLQTLSPLPLPLLVLGTEGEEFRNVASTFVIVADELSALTLHSRHGAPASRDPF